MSISLYTMMLAIIVALAMMVLLVRIGERRHAAVLWLAMALGCGWVSTLLFDLGGTAPFARAGLYLFDPVAAFCVAQSVRLALGRSRVPRAIVATIAAMIATSLLLVAFGAPIRLEYVPAIATSIVSYSVAFAAVWQARGITVRPAFLLFLGIVIVHSIVRLPVFPGLFDSGNGIAGLDYPNIAPMLILTASIAVPGVVLSILVTIMQREIGHYRRQSERDSMTDLLTRKAFSEAVRSGDAGSGVLVVADIDHFKRINDNHGHGVGDEVIGHFAQMLASRAPMAARMGGEEFAIALPSMSLPQAEEISDRLRRDFSLYRHPAFAEGERVSASFGLASYSAKSDLRTALAQADRALYRAKRMGRNMVCIFGTNEFERPEARAVGM